MWPPQVFIQVVLALCRVVMVVLMVATTGLAYDDRRQDFPGQTGGCVSSHSTPTARLPACRCT